MFPSALKLSVMTPYHKLGLVDNLGNYRSINSHTTISNIFEKVLIDRLFKFFKKHSLFCSSQHGYLNNKITSTAIFELTEKVLEAVEKDEI